MRPVLAVLLTAVLAAPAASQTSSSKEPKEITEIGGRTLDQWIKDITHKDPSKRELAIRTVLGFGPEKAYEAVPAMLTELRRNSTTYPIDTSVRVNLAISLGAILGAKKDSSKGLKDADQKIIKDAVVLMKTLLKDTQGIVKFRAAQAVAGLGSDALPAVNELLSLLQDDRSCEVRQAGAAALGKVARDPKTGPIPVVVTRLQGLLKDDAFNVRQAAAQSLATLGPPTDTGLSKAVLGSLEPVARKDSEPVVRIWAHMAIMTYSGSIETANMEQITQLLHKGDVSTRVQAAQALGIVGPLAKETVPVLASALKDPDNDVKGWTIWALGRMETDRAVAALTMFAIDPAQPDMLKKAAKDALEQVRKKKADGGAK